MKRTPLRKVSYKRGKQQEVWNQIVIERWQTLEGRCEKCGQFGQLSGYNRIVGHHIRHRAGCPSRDTPDNCMILHFECHRIVHAEEGKRK